MRTYHRRIFESFRSHVEDQIDHHGRPDVEPEKVHLWKTFFKFLRILIPYWDKVVLLVMLVTSASITGMLWPWLGKFFVDEALPNQDHKLYWTIIWAGNALILCNWFFWRLNWFFTRYIDLWVLSDLQSRFYDHLVRLSMTFMQNRPVGEHIFRAGSDIWGVMYMITDLLPQFLEAIIQFIIILLALSYLDWRVAAIVILFMIPYGAVVHWMANLLRRFDRERRERWQVSTAVLQDGVAGKMVVKSFARRRFEVKKFLAANITAWRTQMKFQYTRIMQNHLAGRWGFVPWIKSWLIRSWFFRECILGHITYGSLFPIFSYMNRLGNPIQRVINMFQSLRVAMIPAERIMQTLDVAPVVTNAPGAPMMPPLGGRVQFRDVHFQYEEDVPVLRGLDFTVERGQKAAFVGHSGAGKSTILNLVLRLYDPQRGQVCVDDTDIRTVRMESLQQQIGLVFQETYLFVGSIRDNILFAHPRATEEEIWKAIRLADLEEFVKSHPEGLDTDLHEGTALSGGQKQRLGIARAIVRDPQLLILDEPTSSLDADTEDRVLETLKKAMVGRTTLIISHRLPTVIDADMIFAMDMGQVVESGSHDELMALSGYYNQLYTLYFAGKRIEDDDDASPS